MYKKVLNTALSVFLIFSSAICVFAQDMITVERNGDYIKITGIIESALESEKASLLVVNHGVTLEDVLDSTGDLTYEIAYINQFVLDENKAFEAEVPFNDKFAFGSCKFYVGAESLEQNLFFQIDILKLTIQKNEGGSVSKTGEIRIIKGEQYTLNVIPDEDNIIDYIKYNNTVVNLDDPEEFDYTTPDILNDSLIKVEFGVYYLIPPEEFPVPDKAYSSYESEVHVGIDGQDTTAPYGISFARAKFKYSDYQRDEWGILFSKNELLKNEFTLENPNVSILKATVAPNGLGQYGIKLYGNEIKNGVTYYTRAYAIYKNSENSTVYTYADKINSFIPGSGLL